MASSMDRVDVPQFNAALRGYHREAVHDRIGQLVSESVTLAQRAAELEDEIATMQQAIDRHRRAPAFAVMMRRLDEVLGSAYDDADRIQRETGLAAKADRERAKSVVATQLNGLAELALATAELTRAGCAALIRAAGRDAEQLRAFGTRATNGATAAADTIVRVTEEEARDRATEVLGDLLLQRRIADAAAQENVAVPARRRPALLPTPAPTVAR